MIPPAPTRALVLRSLARKPRWALRYLRAGQLAAPHLSPLTGQAGLLATDHMAFEPALSWADIVEVRDQWPGRLLLKGPLRADDVRQAVAIGADGVVLSNHGGRQLDKLPPPLHSLREVRDAVGDSAAVLVDSGFRRGGDIAIALALGADAVLIGRPYVYGLGAEGEPGVDLALRILTEELRRTMLLLGVSSVAELRSSGADLVRVAAFQ
jgi:L-lactate dehydrogenase (cytochrome)